MTQDSTGSFPFRELVRAVLAEQATPGWDIRDDAFWCRVSPPEPTRRVQGWKLHVSATPLSAPHVLVRSARVLVGSGCAFKFAADLGQVVELTSQRSDRSQAGKFITAYPRDDDHLRDLAGALDEATAGLPGPAVLSDRPYRRGGLVYYRYGAFDGVRVLSNDGSYETRIETPDGRHVVDVRRPWFAPPPWADLPIPGPAGRDAKRQSAGVLLRDRYVVGGAIRHAARGGVYRASDRTTGADVIIKQARAHIGGSLDGTDVRDGLRREAAALERLSGVGPELVELFEQDGHLFLVESKVDGESVAAWVRRRYSDGDDRPFETDEVVHIAGQIVEAVERLHGQGLVLRDLSPGNLMVGVDGTVSFIDPEGLTAADAWVSRMYTPGYGAPETMAGRSFGPAPAPTADLYSLGVVLFFLVTGVHPDVAADEVRSGAEHLAALLDLVGPGNEPAHRFTPVILGLCATDPQQRWSLARTAEFLAVVPTPPVPTVRHGTGPVSRDRPRGDDWVELLAGGLQHLLVTVNAAAPDRIAPTGPFGASTDPLNLQHGAAGPLSTLARASDVLGRADLRDAAAGLSAWVADRIALPHRELPGLYFGRAGTAWALCDAGRLLDDEVMVAHAVGLARRIPVEWPNPDVFHGAAGAGLAQLHLWHVTGDSSFLDRARECADRLVLGATEHDDGLMWTVPADFDSVLAGATHLGYAHGVAGVGTFLLAVAQVTGDPSYLAAAQGAGRTLATSVERGPWGGRWRTSLADPAGTGMLYNLCNGASGVGTFLLRLWVHTGADWALDLSRAAAESVHRSRWFVGSANCHGLAGNGQFLLDMAQHLGGAYQAWAGDLADILYARRVVHKGQTVVPDESGSRIVVDHGVGLTGVIDFLLRLTAGGDRPFLVDAAVRSDQPALVR